MCAQAMWLIYTGCVLQGLTGSYGVFIMAAFAYGADVARDTPSARGKQFALIAGEAGGDWEVMMMMMVMVRMLLLLLVLLLLRWRVIRLTVATGVVW
jgi:hypothetical protein